MEIAPQVQDNWIQCKEKMPPENTLVKILHIDGKVGKGYWWGGRRREVFHPTRCDMNIPTGNFFLVNVVAWAKIKDSKISGGKNNEQ